MAATIKQFEGSVVSPKDDAILHQIFNSQNGIISGCEITHIGSNQMRIQEGYAYICGRMVHIEEETVSSAFSRYGEVEGEVILKIDILSDTPAKIEARTPRQEILQENINADGTVYEYVLATYKITDVAITSITETSDIVSSGLGSEIVYTTSDQVKTASFQDAIHLVSAGVIKFLFSAIDNMPTTRYGTSDPDNSLGKDGDIYIKLVE